MWLKAVGLLFLVAGSLALEGYKILEVSPKNEEEFNVVAKLADTYDFLKLTSVEPSDVLVSPEQYETLSQLLSKYNVEYKVINENVLEDAIAEAEENSRFCATTSRLGTDCYRSHQEINNYIDSLQIKYPNRTFVKQVGLSYEKRPLKTITITNGDGRIGKKIIFVDAGMHAREWLSPAVGIYVIQQLVENFTANHKLLKDFDWVVMPMINADGYEYTRNDTKNRMWRKTRKPYGTCFGADPNRNFDYKFGFAGTSDDPCEDIFKGPTAFSEPETAVLRDQLKSHRKKISFYLTLHSYGAYLLYPWGYDRVDAPNTKELEDVAQAGYQAILKYSGRKYKVGNSAKLLYPAAGASDDYAYSQGARISMTMELPRGGLRGFDPPPKDIKKHAEETWVGIVAMASRVIEKY